MGLLLASKSGKLKQKKNREFHCRNSVESKNTQPKLIKISIYGTASSIFCLSLAVFGRTGNEVDTACTAVRISDESAVLYIHVAVLKHSLSTGYLGRL